MSMPDCLVVQPIAESAMARLEAAGLKVHVAADTDFATLRPYLAQARAVITRNHGLSEREVEAAPHLRVVGVHGTGTDRVAKQALAARDIPLFNTPGANARSAGRFSGEEAEPRAGLRSGHMPGAINIPFGDVIDGERMKSSSDLRALFASRGVDVRKPIITSCGSGVTAAVLALALDVVGAPNVAVYDGSWTEWGGRSDAPVVSG